MRMDSKPGQDSGFHLEVNVRKGEKLKQLPPPRVFGGEGWKEDRANRKH